MTYVFGPLVSDMAEKKNTVKLFKKPSMAHVATETVVKYIVTIGTIMGNINTLCLQVVHLINPVRPSDNYMYHLLKHTKTLRPAHTVYLCVPYGSHNKQPLFPQTALTGWAL
jgi:hypothetical protein